MRAMVRSTFLAVAICALSPSAWATTDLRGLTFVQMVPPEYPAIARRYNVQGVVTVQLSIGKTGRVEGSEVLESSADVLSDAVQKVTSRWRLSAPEEPTVVTVDVPFLLSNDGPSAFRVGIRPINQAPLLKSDLGSNAVDGWATAYIIVSDKNAKTDYHVARISDPSFRKTLEQVIEKLRFDAALPDGTTGSVNILRIQVDDTSISIEQLAGDNVLRPVQG